MEYGGFKTLYIPRYKHFTRKIKKLTHCVSVVVSGDLCRFGACFVMPVITRSDGKAETRNHNGHKRNE